MIQKIKRHLVALSASILLVAPTMVAVPVALAAPTTGDSNTISGAICGSSQTITLDSQQNCGSGDTSSLNTFLQWAVNIFSAIVGIIAVIMIIVGGLKYITSGGDSSKVGSAKNTLLYAIIGLIIVALAQIIVHFVIGKATSSVSGL